MKLCVSYFYQMVTDLSSVRTAPPVRDLSRLSMTPTRTLTSAMYAVIIFSTKVIVSPRAQNEYTQTMNCLKNSCLICMPYEFHLKFKCSSLVPFMINDFDKKKKTFPTN